MTRGGDLAARIRSLVRDVPDFPKPGILFKDITPVLSDGALMAAVNHRLEEISRPLRPERVVAIESRGFIIGAPLAIALHAGFAPIRKPGKLPFTTRRVDYALEYGTDAVEAHVDAVAPGQRVLIVDDVLATGGTAAAAARLVRELGGSVVGYVFVIELALLAGRARLTDAPVSSLLRYEH